MKKIYPLLEGLSSLIPTSATIRITRQQLFFPIYHTLRGDAPLPHIHHLYPPKSVRQFEKDLDFFLKYYQPISLDEVVQNVLNHKPLKHNSFHPTFDDGLREVYDFAFPILQKKGIPATVFLNSAFVDNQDLFYRYEASLLIEKIQSNTLPKNTIQAIFKVLGKNVQTEDDAIKALLSINFKGKNILKKIAQLAEIDFYHFLNTQQPYLTSEQIRTLQKNNFTFGAHSIEHPNYTELSLSEKIHQTKKSINFIQENFQEKYKTFAFPFHDLEIEHAFFKQVENEQIADLTFGGNIFSTRNIPWHIQRFPMEGNNLNTAALFNFKSLFYFAKHIRTLKAT